MIRRIFLFAILLAAAFGQTADPEQKAYREANTLSDPEQKIAALTKFKSDFPESLMLERADQAILSTMVSKLPEQAGRIRKFAAGVYRNAPEKDRGAMANQIAVQLLGAGILLKDAAEYSRRSINAMSLDTYVSAQIAAYRDREQTPPWTRDLETRFRASRAMRLATLGRIELKLGHTARSRRLLEEAYAAQPTSAAIQAALGELAAQAGDDSKALEYLIPARLSGQSSKEAIAALEAVYRKQHGNSLEGLDAMLDREYRQRYPNPITVEPYRATANRSDRMVLAEVFTGSACAPCIAADLAFDAAMERYSRKDLAVVMYHQHIPRPDPMTNPNGQARYKSYGGDGVPAFAIDGKKFSGGGSRDMTAHIYSRFDPEIGRQLESPAEATLQVGVLAAGDRVTVTVDADRVKSDSKDLKVEIVLVEKSVRFSGESGIRFHPMVARAMGGKDGAGFDLNPAVAGHFEHTFGMDEVSKALETHLATHEFGGYRGDRINRSNLAVVVFVQDDKSRHVLQAAYVDLDRESTSRPITEAVGTRR